MEIENAKDLQDAIKYTGYPDSVYDKVISAIQAGNNQPVIEHFAILDNKDEMRYKLHFRKAEDLAKVYFNKIEAGLLKNIDSPGDNREHTFSMDKHITATEAYHMLKHGDKVAVNKNLFNKEGQKYNTWILIDVSGPKDEYNNYPVQTYHQNYFIKKPFDIISALKALPFPIKELQQQDDFVKMEKALRKAKLPEVMMVVDGQEQRAYLSVNPKERRIDIYDADMQLLQVKQEQHAQDEVLAKFQHKKKALRAAEGRMAKEK